MHMFNSTPSLPILDVDDSSLEEGEITEAR